MASAWGIDVNAALFFFGSGDDAFTVKKGRTCGTHQTLDEFLYDVIETRAICFRNPEFKTVPGHREAIT